MTVRAARRNYVQLSSTRNTLQIFEEVKQKRRAQNCIAVAFPVYTEQCLLSFFFEPLLEPLVEHKL